MARELLRAAGRRNLLGGWRSNWRVSGIQPDLLARPEQAAAQLGIWKPRDAGAQAHQRRGDAGVIEGRGHFARQAALRVIHVRLGKILRQFQQLQRRGGMMKQSRRSSSATSFGLRSTSSAAPPCRDRNRPGPPERARTSGGGRWPPIPPDATAGRSSPLASNRAARLFGCPLEDRFHGVKLGHNVSYSSIRFDASHLARLFQPRLASRPRNSSSAWISAVVAASCSAYSWITRPRCILKMRLALNSRLEASVGERSPKRETSCS